MSEKLYVERYRPQYHLTPPQGPMSDPNGMVVVDGEFHQFYQFTGQWGHAVSRDLIHWEHLPLALVKDELGDIWSGSCVNDRNNTSGLFDDEFGMIALFTHFKDGLQSQSMAYSRDKGRSWTKYEGNPVIPNPGLKDFRDPKVLWHDETASWVMVVSVDKEVYFYSSSNLKSWRFESRFGEGQGCRSAVWECPDLFRLPVAGRSGQFKWVLHISIGDNRETDGSTAQYFIGEFDGHMFLNDDASGREIRWTDYGQDFYAAVTYSGLQEHDGRTVWLGWTSNWKYPFAGPTSPWKGGMSIPRALTLKEGRDGRLVLCQQPVEELKTLRSETVGVTDFMLENSVLKLAATGSSYEVELLAEWDVESAPEAFGLYVRCAGGERTVIGYEPGKANMFLDRTASGQRSFVSREGKAFDFGKRFAAPHASEHNRLRLRVFVDESVVELFADDGETVFTALIYPEGAADGIELFADKGSVAIREASVYRMKSVWPRSL